jgi:non-heme chloroperoxidase
VSTQLEATHTLVMHGEDDRIVPINDSAKKSVHLIHGVRAVYCPGKLHRLSSTYADRVNTDLLEFLTKPRKHWASALFTE